MIIDKKDDRVEYRIIISFYGRDQRNDALRCFSDIEKASGMWPDGYSPYAFVHAEVKKNIKSKWKIAKDIF